MNQIYPSKVDAGRIGTPDRPWGRGYFKSISPGNAYDSELKIDTVNISNAEIKALRASPKELVAAPGAGKFLELISAILMLDYGSNALTESSDDLVIQYGKSGVDATASIDSTNFLTATADTMIKVLGAAIAYTAVTDIVNNALVLFNTGDGEIAGNAAADTKMIVKITYRVHTTGL